MLKLAVSCKVPVTYIHSGYLTNGAVKGLVPELSNFTHGPTPSQGQICNQDPVLLTPHLRLPVLSGHSWWLASGSLSVQASCGLEAGLPADLSLQSCGCGHDSFS